MPDKPTACIAFPVGEEGVARIERECRVRVVEPGRRDRLPEALADADGLLCGAMLPVDAALLDAAPRLRVVSNFGVGFDNVDLAAATERGIAVCNTPGVLSDAVADLTMLMVLQMARGASEAAAFARDGRWSRRESLALGFDVAGKTLGIVGFGRIGRAVARRADAFAMRVVFHDIVRDDAEVPASCTSCALDDLLRESDFVSLHVNLTPATRRLISTRELELMKPSAYLINTSRGQVVDQPALAAALAAGVIAGAALDVLEVEPPPADDPILRAPNVLLLPHIGSATRETRAAMRDLAVANLLAVLRGEAPRCCVNPEALPRALAGRAGADRR